MQQLSDGASRNWVRNRGELVLGPSMPPWGAPSPHSTLALACAAMGWGMWPPPKDHPDPRASHPFMIPLWLAPTVQGCSETHQTCASGEGCSVRVPTGTRRSRAGFCWCCPCFLMACAVCFSVCVVSPVKWKWSSESAQPLLAPADAGAATSPWHAPLGRLS